MKKVYLFTIVLLITLFTNVMWAQTLLLEENFDYTAGELLTAHGWTAHSGGGTNPITVVSPGLTFAGYIGSGIGNAAGVNNTGEDVNKQFTQQTSGVIYAAFIVQTQSTNSAGYFFHLGQYTIGTTFISRVWVNATGDGLGIGSTTPTTYVPITVGVPTLVVVKYDMASKISSLFVFNSFPNSEPNTADATFTETATVSNIGSVALRQYNASQQIVIDGIRVATTWEEAVKAPDMQAPMATFIPTNAQTNVAVNVQPTITFDEPIRNIDNSVIDNTNVDSLITFKETNVGGADVPFTATIDATQKIITVTPSANLLFNQTYYLAIAPVEDQYDNATTTQSITFTTEMANNQAEITQFNITNQISSTINSTNGTIDVVMPYGTDVSNLTPSITISAGATISPASGVAQDFTNPVTYTVTAQDGTTTKNWTVTVTTQLNNEAEILTFTIPSQVSSTINSTNGTVDVLMPYGTDVSNLTPAITISAGATINPASGVAQDFTNPVQYTVTAENGIDQKIWTVTIAIDNPIYVSLVEWTFPNNPDDSLADGGITANLDKIITNTATGTTTYTYAGASSYCARATGWDAGTDTKYWQVDFKTLGYEMIRFSSKQRSSSTGPRDFKVQYMIDNDGNWQDVPNAAITCADNWTSGVLTDIELPSVCDQKNLVSLRWIMTSDSSVNNSIVASTGSSRIDDIIVKGVEHSLNTHTTTLPTIAIYPNPTNHWLYIHSYEKVLNVNIIGIDGKIISVIWNNDAIDVKSLPTGMYILNVSTLSKTYKLNFIKQ